MNGRKARHSAPFHLLSSKKEGFPMARKVMVRPNYMQEAITMRRFVNAVTIDPNASAAWKKEVTEHLQIAMRLFLQEDERRGKSA